MKKINVDPPKGVECFFRCFCSQIGVMMYSHDQWLAANKNLLGCWDGCSSQLLHQRGDGMFFQQPRPNHGAVHSAISSQLSALTFDKTLILQIGG